MSQRPQDFRKVHHGGIRQLFSLHLFVDRYDLEHPHLFRDWRGRLRLLPTEVGESEHRNRRVGALDDATCAA